MRLLRSIKGTNKHYHKMGVFRCPECRQEFVRRISEVQRKKQKTCMYCCRRRNGKPRKGPWGGLPWTSEEDSILWLEGVAGGKKRRELAALLPNRTLKAIRDRQLRLGIRQPSENYKNRFVGHSLRQAPHPGPPGWTPADGPPCLKCQYHEAKTMYADDDVEGYFRRECAECKARIAWDMVNGGLPGRPEGAFEAHIYCDW